MEIGLYTCDNCEHDFNAAAQPDKLGVITLTCPNCNGRVIYYRGPMVTVADKDIPEVMRIAEERLKLLVDD